MRYSISAVATIGLTAGQVAGTVSWPCVLKAPLLTHHHQSLWGYGGEKYGSVPVTDNHCNPDQEKGFSWDHLPEGNPIDSYGGINFEGFKSATPYRKRDVLSKRTDSSRSISCGVSKQGDSAKIYSGAQPFSVKQYQVTVDIDVDVEFHYGMEDGSTCKHTTRCSAGGSVVPNTQCGGAKHVSFKVPDYETKDNYELDIYKIDFDCNPAEVDTSSETYSVSSSADYSQESSQSYYGESSTYSSTSTEYSAPVTDVATSTDCYGYGCPAASTATDSYSTTSEGYYYSSSSAEYSTSTTDAPSSTDCYGYGCPETTTAYTTTDAVYSTTVEYSTSDAELSSTSAAYSTSEYYVDTSSTSAAYSTSEYYVDTSSTSAAYSTSEYYVDTSSTSAAYSTSEYYVDTSSTSVAYSTSEYYVETSSSSAEYYTSAPYVETSSTSAAYYTSATDIVSYGESTSVEYSSTVVSYAEPTSADYQSTSQYSAVETSSYVSQYDYSSYEVSSYAPYPTGPSVQPAKTCPDVLPKCLNTWMYKTGCKDNTDKDCYCKNADYTKNVIGCVTAWGADNDKIQKALSYLAGICAAYVPENPAIITACPTTFTLDMPKPTGTTAEPTIPYTTVTVENVVTVPCSYTTGESSGQPIPSSSTVSKYNTAIVVPKVDFATQSAGCATCTADVELYPDVPGAVPYHTPVAPAQPGESSPVVATGTMGTVYTQANAQPTSSVSAFQGAGARARAEIGAAGTVVLGVVAFLAL